MEDRFVIGGIGVMAVRIPIGGPQMDLDAADGHVVIGFSILLKSDDCPGEIGTAAVIPKSGLDDFDSASVVRGQGWFIKLLKPKRLDFHLGWL
jgi:hypothetical protein